MENGYKKMRQKALLKIVAAIIGAALVILVAVNTYEEQEAWVTIFIVALWLSFALVYFTSGVNTLRHGMKQANLYIENSRFSKQQLEEEYDNAEDFGSVRVGGMHVFANASNGFYIIPIAEIEKIYVTHEGHNPLKGKRGYYYLRINAQNIEKRIKIYYVSRRRVEAAKECIESRF